MDYDEQTILRDYFRILDDRANDDLYDVVETVDELARNWPLEAWPLVRRLIEIAPTEQALDYVVAGPLEVLLMYHGDEVAPVVAADAVVNAKVKEALAYVIVEPTEAVQRHLGEWLLRSVV